MLDHLLASARAAGADAADALFVDRQSLSVRLPSGQAGISWSARKPPSSACASSSASARRSFRRRMSRHRALAELVERAVAMARVVPEDPFCGLADPDLIGRERVDVDSCEPGEIDLDAVSTRAQAAEGGGAGGGGRHQLGRRRGRLRHQRLRHRRHQRLSPSLSPLLAQPVGVGARRRGHRRWSATTSTPAPSTPKIWRTPAARPALRRKGGPPAASAQGRFGAGADRLRAARRPQPARPPVRRDQRQRRRPRHHLSRRQAGRSASSPQASASSTIRCAVAGCARARSTARASRHAAARSSTTAC